MEHLDFKICKRGKNWVTFNETLAREICELAVDAWQNRHKHLFNCDQPEIVHLPDTFEHGSRLHALYLFAYGSLNRYGKTTNEAMGEGSDLFSQYPWMIDPMFEFDDNIAENLLTGALSFTSKQTEGGQKETEKKLKGWKWNLDLLRQEYDSDPRNIFYQAQRNRAGLIKELSRFYGYGQKVAQLVTLYFQDVDWENHQADWQELNQIAVMPVDLWIGREMRNWQIVVKWSTDKKDPASYLVSDFLVFICEKYHLPWGDVAQAFWHTGANICFKVSKVDVKAMYHCLINCPFHDYCSHRAGGSHQKNKGGFGWGDPPERPRNLFHL